MSGAKIARDSAGLLAGTLINGAFAYVFFALATRSLGAAQAAPVTVLWTYWGMTMAAIAFPLQHWIISTLQTSGERTVRDSLPGMFASITTIAAIATALAWLARERLFLDDGAIFPVLAGLVTFGAFFSGVVRGGLAGRERFLAASFSLAADNVLRVVLAALVLLLGGQAVGMGIALAAGALVGVIWPSGYRFRRDGTTTQESSSLPFLAATAAGSFLGQAVLISGPALLALLGGAPTEVTMLFVTLALFRVPYLLTIGVSNRITGILTSWIHAQRRGHVRAFQATVIAVAVGGAFLAWMGGYIAGPTVVSVVFGGEAAPPRWVAGIVGSGSSLAMGNLLLSLLAISQRQGRRLISAWMLAACIVALMVIGLPQPPLKVVSWSFLAAEGGAFVALLFLTRKPS